MSDPIKRDDALLPCPFCGGKKNTICRTDYDGRDAYAVSCRYPECHGAIFTLGYGYFADKAEAIAAWNTRALPAVDPAAIREAALQARIEALVKERDDLGRKLNTARYGQPDFAWAIHEEAMADLRTKLAKAVEAVKNLKSQWHIRDLVNDDFNTVLAELEGR